MYKLTDKPFSAPLFVNWNFNYACNFNCNHCYSRIDYRYPEMGIKELNFIADQLIKANIFIVAFGGGEPFVSKHIYDITHKLSSAGTNTFITTNGWFLNNEIIAKIFESKLTALYISLDSHREDIHDQFRNKPGSFKRITDFLSIASRYSIDVRLST